MITNKAINLYAVIKEPDFPQPDKLSEQTNQAYWILSNSIPSSRISSNSEGLPSRILLIS